MLRNYFVLFVRNLRRHKLFSLINLIGLTVSITSSLLIYLYVSHELSFDRFHHQADRIYRVNQTFIWGEDNNSQFASTGPGVAYALQQELPEVKLITSIHTPGDFIVSYTKPNKEVLSFEETNVLAADSAFFSMFDFPLLKGNPKTALEHANTVVMTASTAKKYFGDENPIGKLIRLRGSNGGEPVTYEVTGVTTDTPSNSYIEYNMLLSMNSFPIKRFYWSWVWTQLETYVLFDDHVDINAVRAKLNTIPRKYAEETLQRVMNTSYDDYIKSGKKWELFLQPLTSIHLPDQMVLNRINESGERKIIYALIGAVAFIVLLSCINFMNLSTAQYARRVKESSIRNILGLGRRELAFNFFFEAAMFCIVAMLAALAITQIALPAFSLLIGKQLTLSLWSNPTLFVTLLVLVIAMALLSSVYPAIYLTAIPAIDAIKGKLTKGREGKTFRQSLLVFQFAVSFILIIATAIVFRQLSYMANKDIGFSKENLLVVKHVENLNDPDGFVKAALQIPGSLKACRSTSLPPTVYGGDKFTAEGLNGESFPLNYTTADENFVPTLGIHLSIGRNFMPDAAGEASRVILNEVALKRIGWPADESVVGRKIKFPWSEDQFEVIGVVSDFNYWSLVTPIEPMAIFHIHNPALKGRGERQYTAIKMVPQDGDSWQGSIQALEKIWRQHAGDVPFQYSFVDDAFADAFRTQQQFGAGLTVLASLAIVIACLGLFGVVIYALERRFKEIGVRKVAGATTQNILTMVLKNYVLLVMVSFLIGAPLAYWLMTQWLEDFAYRVTPGADIFVVAGVSVLLLTVALVGFQAWRASKIDPVKVLRSE